MTNMTRTTVAIALAAALAAGCAKSAPVTTQSSGSGGATGGTVVIAAGTDFYGKLQQHIGSKVSKDGDTFTLVDTDTLFHKDPALQGAQVTGHLANVSAAGPMHKPAMTLVFDQIQLPDGTTAPVSVQLVSMNAFEPKTHHLRTIGLMIGGAMAGHAMSHQHGGLMGAAAGYVLSQQLKTDIDVPAGSVIELRFTAPVTKPS